MDPVSWKKKLGITLLVLGLLLPLFMASNWGLGLIEDWALSRAPEEWAATVDLKVAGFYGVSLRPAKRKAVCERFLEHFPTDPRRGFAKYSIATCVERDIETSKENARNAYLDFLSQYGDDPNSREYVEEAERALVRLKSN